jgi:hypothetical protein
MSPRIVRVIKSRRMRWVGHVTRMGEVINSNIILVRKLERKIWIGRIIRRWEDNIKMEKIGCEYMDWTRVIQD